jgi:hypothetical protein
VSNGICSHGVMAGSVDPEGACTRRTGSVDIGEADVMSDGAGE